MEALLRRKLGNYSLPVEEQEWTDFLDFAQKKKKKKGGLWMSLVLFALLSLSTFGYLAQQNYFDSSEEAISSSNAIGSQEGTSDKSIFQNKESNSNPADDNSLMSSNENQDSESRGIESITMESQRQSNPVKTPQINTENTPLKNINLERSTLPEYEIQRNIEGQENQNWENARVLLNNSLLSKNSFAWDLEKKSLNFVYPLESLNNSKGNKRPKSLLALYLTTSAFQGQNAWTVNRQRDSNDIIHRQYAEALEKNSMNFKGVNIEMGIRFPLSKGLSVSSGLEFSSRTQKSNFSFIRSEFPIINSNGQIVAYIPDSFGVDLNADIQESVTSFNIPIQLSYQINIIPNLSLGIRGGIQMGFQSVKSQKSLDPLRLIEISRGQSTPKTSFSYSGGLFVEYRLKESWGVNLAVDRRTFNPAYKAGQAFNSIPKVYDFRFTLIRFL